MTSIDYPAKVLVIQTAFLGDAVLASALLETLHQLFPKASLHVLVRDGNQELFLGHPYLARVLVWQKKKEKYNSLRKLFGLIRQEKYDWVLNLQRFAATGFLTVFSGAEYTAGFSKNPFSRFFSVAVPHRFDDGLHEVQRNQRLLEPLLGKLLGDGVKDNLPFPKPRLYPNEPDFAKVRRFRQDAYICIAPASVWFTKQFPKESWRRAVKELSGKYSICIVGAASDRKLADYVLEAANGMPSFNLAGSLTFLESAALMAGAKMNYTNDSGAMHLCSAVDAPVSAIFCSTTPALGFGPLSSNSQIIETSEALACRPCDIHGKTYCPEHHFRCALGIDPRRLVKSLP